MKYEYAMQEFESTRIYVGNLPLDVRRSHLIHLFSRIGTVRDVFLPRQTEAARRTYAFVEMTTPEESQVAVEIMHRIYGPDGAELDVRPANLRKNNYGNGNPR
jgi:RNA recognition motif-containing protein